MIQLKINSFTFKVFKLEVNIFLLEPKMEIYMNQKYLNYMNNNLIKILKIKINKNINNSKTVIIDY